MGGISKVLLAASAGVLLSATAWAAGGHKGGHSSFGEPGREGEVTRTVEVTATDDMELHMDLDSIRQGETIEFVVTNTGQTPHEFSIGDTGSQRAHANLMKKNPHMKHHGDPSMLTLGPGETGTLVWKFSKPVQGDIVFACQMPGHWDAGMLHRVELEGAGQK